VARKGMPHTHFPIHTKVRIVLMDGSVEVDRFVERKGKYIVFRNGEYTADQVKSMTIWRNKS
jgi:hypothetical protein